MRDFEERKAEVFRRSEKRINARKLRRNCILTACVPLALCLALAVAFRFPAGSEEAGTQDGLTGGVSGGSYENLVFNNAEISVSGLDFSQTYTEFGDVLRIYDQLNAYAISTSEEAAENPEQDDGERKYAAGAIYGGAESSGYTIVLQRQDGVRRVYFLHGNELTDQTASQTYTLTPDQVEQLKDLLGIPRE